MMRHPIRACRVKIALDNTIHPVGLLVIKNRLIYFQYASEFLALNLDLSPFKLPLKSDVCLGDTALFSGLHGVFNDSLPDGWGQLLMDRHLRRKGIESGALSPLDRLAYVGARGMGALIYEPDCSEEFADGVLALDTLAQESRCVLEDKSEFVFDDLLALNGSSAGARPKILVGASDDFTSLIAGVDDLPEKYSHWMIKFPASQDPRDIAAIEYAYSLMAKDADIEMMPTHLFVSENGSRYFGVQRFDRNKNTRIHVHTACGLLHADFRLPSLDYKDLLLATRYLTRNQGEVEKMFRLGTFNVFSHNRDDHSKNFSFLMNAQGNWRLSPAYDLVFSSGPGGEHSTSVLGEGKTPTRETLIALAQHVDINITNAKNIIDQVRDSVANWKHYAKLADVSQASQNRVAQFLTG
jgi:serine/threonine-protein kinase HipA